MKSIAIVLFTFIMNITPALSSSSESIFDSPSSLSSSSSSTSARSSRSCSYTEWTDAFAAETQKKQKQTFKRPVSPLLEKTYELAFFIERIENDRDILRESAEKALGQESILREDELLHQWSVFWGDAIETRLSAQKEE